MFSSWPYSDAAVLSHLAVLLPYNMLLVNLSLKSGVFPTSYKQYHITSLKVIETAVANHLMKHFDQHQSAYHPSHSFQTALQHVYSSVLHQLDRCRAGFIVLIDLSAAFDSVLWSSSVTSLITVWYWRQCVEMDSVIFVMAFISCKNQQWVVCSCPVQYCKQLLSWGPFLRRGQLKILHPVLWSIHNT